MKYEENILELAQLQPDYMGIIFYDKSPRYVDKNIPVITSAIKKTGVFVNADISFIQQKIEEYNLQAVQLHGNETVEYCQELKKRLEIPFESAQGDIQQNIKNLNEDEIPNQIQDNELPNVNLNSSVIPSGIEGQHYITKEYKDKNLKQIQGNERYQEIDSASHQTKLNSVEIIKAFSIKDKFNFQELEKYLPVIDYFLFDTKGKQPGGNGYTFDWKILEKYPFQKPFFLSGGIGLEEVEKIKEIQKLNLPIYSLDVNSKFETVPGKKSIEKLKNFKKKINN